MKVSSTDNTLQALIACFSNLLAKAVFFLSSSQNQPAFHIWKAFQSKLKFSYRISYKVLSRLRTVTILSLFD